MHENWSTVDLQEEVHRLRELAQHEHAQFVYKSGFATEQARISAHQHQVEANRYRMLAERIAETLKMRGE